MNLAFSMRVEFERASANNITTTLYNAGVYADPDPFLTTPPFAR